MSNPRLTISDWLKERFSYRTLSRRVPRVFILHGEYWVDAACARAVERLGWEVCLTPVTMRGEMTREMLGQFLERLIAFQPDYVLSINLAGMDEDGLFAALLEDLTLPHAIWFVDDPRTILMGRSTFSNPYTIAFTWERCYTDYLRGVGFPAVHTLPLGVDESLFNAAPAETTTDDLAFVGTSMAYVAAEQWTWISEHSALATCVTQAFESGRVTRETFGQGLDTILGEDAASFDEHERRQAEMYLFVEGTRRLRESLVNSFAHEGFIVYGGVDWQPYKANVRPPVAYGQELADVYRRSAVNLNTTSVQMATAVNQRVFDCPAAGGFLLTDAQESLSELFEEGTEVAVYHDFDEAVQLARAFRGAPERRRTIIERARSRIMAEHTYRHRMQTITQIVRERFG